MYSNVVAVLNSWVMDRVIDIIRKPPAAGTHYQAIEDNLLSAFGWSPLERSKTLLDYTGMGDRSPSALFSKMLACLPTGENSEQDHLAHSTAL